MEVETWKLKQTPTKEKAGKWSDSGTWDAVGCDWWGGGPTFYCFFVIFHFWFVCLIYITWRKMDRDLNYSARRVWSTLQSATWLPNGEWSPNPVPLCPNSTILPGEPWLHWGSGPPNHIHTTRCKFLRGSSSVPFSPAATANSIVMFEGLR